jgi:C-terminal processing protease CtpA/Prc
MHLATARWSFVCCLGIAVGWTYAAANPVQVAQEKKDQSAEDKEAAKDKGQPEPKKGPDKKVGVIPDLDQILPKDMQKMLTPAQLQQLRLSLERARQQLDQARQQMDRARQLPGFQGRARFSRGVNRLGARLEQPSEVLVEQLGLPPGHGLVLATVQPDSAAAKAGLKKNDVLLELGGKKVAQRPAEFLPILDEFKTGDKVDAVILRGGKKETVKDVVLPEIPANRFNVPNVRPRLRAPKAQPQN